jgi:wyosine [tRNA(Phe)-imidazoG37] synthetase (radical SAM superfamily)
MSTLLATSAVKRPHKQAPYPRQLVLDWTDYCNAKCFFCFREKYEEAIGGMGEFIPSAKQKKFEDVLSKVEIFGISSGIGEPLLHPELDEFLTWLYTINPSIKLQVVTNGTTLTAKKAPWFAGHLDWLSVSLNASNAEAHMRDMFPHLARRSVEAEKRWNLHVRHLTEFLSALPAGGSSLRKIPDGGSSA